MFLVPGVNLNKNLLFSCNKRLQKSVIYVIIFYNDEMQGFAVYGLQS